MYTPSHPHSIHCLFVNFIPNSDGLQLESIVPTQTQTNNAALSPIMMSKVGRAGPEPHRAPNGQKERFHFWTVLLPSPPHPDRFSVLSYRLISYLLLPSMNHGEHLGLEFDDLDAPPLPLIPSGSLGPQQGRKSYRKSRYLPACPRTRCHPCACYGIISRALVWSRHQRLRSSTYSVSR